MSVLVADDQLTNKQQAKTALVFAMFPPNKQFIDITGRVYGRLTVLGFAGRSNRASKWFCECDCGTITCVRAGNLQSGHTVSCGCESLRVVATHRETFNGKPSVEYVAYYSAKTRCESLQFRQRANYGGRGIEFRFTSFEHFLSVLGRRPSPKHSLDRIDNDGHYEPGNVRWATKKEQYRNMTKNHWLEYKGKRQTLTEWADEIKIPRNTLDGRVNKGNWCISCALTLPLHSRCLHREVFNAPAN